MSGALAEGSAHLRSQMTAFLNFCRLEKGLSRQFARAPIPLILIGLTSLWESAADLPGRRKSAVIIDHLYQGGAGQPLGGPAPDHAPQFLRFPAAGRRSRPADPTEHLRTPKQWQTIPKYLNLEEIEKIIQAPDLSRPTGLRDRAMMELLYASGLAGQRIVQGRGRRSGPGYGRPAHHGQGQQAAPGPGGQGRHPGGPGLPRRRPRRRCSRGAPAGIFSSPRAADA